MEKVAAVNTSAGSEGWLELNVTSALSAWLSSPADNRGFFITLHPHSQPGMICSTFSVPMINTHFLMPQVGRTTVFENTELIAAAKYCLN